LSAMRNSSPLGNRLILTPENVAFTLPASRWLAPGKGSVGPGVSYPLLDSLGFAAVSSRGKATVRETQRESVNPVGRYFQNTAKSAGSTLISPFGNFRPLRSPRRIHARTVYSGALSHAATSFVVIGVLRARRWSRRSTLRKYCVPT
jgi:hypothetical protein